MKSSKFASEKIIKQFLIITVHSGPVQHCVARSSAAAVRAAQLLTRAAQLLQQHAAHHYARLRPTTTRAQQPTLKSRGPAAQCVALAAPPRHPGSNLGLGQDSSCPPGLYSAWSNSRRQSESDGQASISEDKKPPPTAASPLRDDRKSTSGYVFTLA